MLIAWVPSEDCSPLLLSVSKWAHSIVNPRTPMSYVFPYCSSACLCSFWIRGQNMRTHSLMGPDWLAHSSPNAPFAELVSPNCDILVYLMESFTAFKIWETLPAHAPHRGRSFSAPVAIAICCVWPWFLPGEMKLRICVHCCYTCPFSMEHHRSSTYFPHIPKFSKTALQWRGISILFLLSTIGMSAKFNPTQWQSKFPFLYK